MAMIDFTDARDDASRVTSNAASVLRGLIDAGEQGIQLALENLRPLAEQLDGLFGDESNPIPSAPSGGVPTVSVIAEGGSDLDAAAQVGVAQV